MDIITSTSSDILLLSQKLDLLESYFNWIIGGISITIVIIMGIFALIQFIYQRKIQNSKLKKVSETLKKEIEEEFKKKENTLTEKIQNEVNKTKEELRSDINALSGDLSRSYALSCDQDGLMAIAFTWWMDAIIKYSNLDDSELFRTSVKAAKNSLEKVKLHEVNHLIDRATDINKSLDELVNAHPVEAELLRGIFIEKLKSDEDKNQNK